MPQILVRRTAHTSQARAKTKDAAHTSQARAPSLKVLYVELRTLHTRRANETDDAVSR